MLFELVSLIPESASCAIHACTCGFLPTLLIGLGNGAVLGPLTPTISSATGVSAEQLAAQVSIGLEGCLAFLLMGGLLMAVVNRSRHQ